MTPLDPPVHGVCPILETPFLPDGALDEDSFTRLIDHVLRHGADSVMFPGFASEFHKLTEAERSRLATIVIDRSAVFGRPAVISVSAQSTFAAVEHAIEAAEAGATAINLLPPYLTHVGLDAVADHLSRVMAAISPLPVIVQYAPALTGVAIPSDVFETVARRHQNFRQVKVETSPPGRFVEVLQRLDTPLSSIVGYAGVQLIDALRRGVDGVQPGCSFVEIYRRVWDLWSAGDRDGATELHRRLMPYISTWMQDVELIIAAEKRISALRRIIDHDTCRTPAYTLDRLDHALIEEFLVDFTDLLPEPGSSDHKQTRTTAP